ncbi:Sensor protein ZraS [Paenibacillus konkukensis]|uniref:histidine kinase n=1 Tax=Paenibacillus konkukensis TaxID=2020716 RepID=A0ABY4RP88_9BACL|nr:sensor histidine kinase [Paenibacillus konkukensis]UQZ83539.1 Sensor protein ZraS [Paenibacillus konkukensis]
MTILLIVLMLAAIVLFITKSRNPSAYWMGFVLVGWFLSMAGLILFIAKYGGFYYKVNIVLFFNDSIRNFLLDLPIKIEGISRMITIGRSLFVFSLIGLSVTLFYYRPFKQLWKIFALNTLFPLANIVFYDPVVYKWALTALDRSFTYTIGWVTRGWLVVSLLVSLALMIQKYRKMTVPWVKKQSKHILYGVFSLVLFYFYLGFMGPLQVFDVRTYYVLYSDFSNFNPPLTLFGWYASIGFTGVLSLISILSIWRYTEVEKSMGKSDLQLQRKLNTANMGARVFTHAIKNQLIMIQLLIQQAKQQTAAAAGQEGASNGPQETLNKAGDIVTHTLGRLDQLYNSFKTNQLQLRAVSVRTLIGLTLERLTALPTHIALETELPPEEAMVLADVEHLSEALYNLLINAVEAIDEEKRGLVRVHGYVEESWVIIQIIDNGPGIEPELLEAIFDPFYTSKNTTKNWGIGLSYSKHVVMGHYGRIHVESKRREGSVFQVILPLYVLKP